jgi:hypothetical protein
MHSSASRWILNNYKMEYFAYASSRLNDRIVPKERRRMAANPQLLFNH